MKKRGKKEVKKKMKRLRRDKSFFWNPGNIFFKIKENINKKYQKIKKKQLVDPFSH